MVFLHLHCGECCFFHLDAVLMRTNRAEIAQRELAEEMTWAAFVGVWFGMRL